MTVSLKHPLCAAQPTARIGHNGGPDMEAQRIFEALGPKPVIKPPVFQCGAPWTGYASNQELIRLGSLQGRIERRETAIAEMRAERTKIMMRCVRRMRRDRGVE